MTREEAIKSLWVPSPPQEWALGAHDAGQFVDRLVALGLLKLDEPKSAMERFAEVMQSIPWDQRTIRKVSDAIDSAGLKIIEK